MRFGGSLWLWLLLVLAIAIRFAEPTPDNDLFWHMAYARQMLASGTLVLDHTTFSWTPVDNGVIYCAWISQLLFHWLWTLVGPWSLFAVRYLVIAVVVALAAGYAGRVGVKVTPLVPALLLVMTLASFAGALLKPELFSLLGFHVCLWVYFCAKLNRLRGGDPARSFYLIPVVLLVWVNTHGGFVQLAPLLAAVWVGEWINWRVGHTWSFSRRSLMHMTAAWSLAALAVTMTPYGLSYPMQLIGDYVFALRERPDVAWNAAHQSVLSRATLGLHLAELCAVLCALLVTLALAVRRQGRRTGVDWSLLLVNAAFVALFLPQLRTTYAWPGVAAYTALFLIARWQQMSMGRTQPSLARPLLPGGQAISGLAIGLAIVFGGRAIVEARVRPYDNSWLGFGIGDQSPVAEAEFLAAARIGPRLYNLFDSGGYLLWRLDPVYKVMTDSRSFPYLSWFDDQRRFTEGEIFDEFLAKYQADVAVIDLRKARTVMNFVNASDWQLVYYGPVSAVFARASVVVPIGASAVAPDRFTHLRNPATARRVFDFAVVIGDVATARTVLLQLESDHAWSLDPSVIEAARQRMAALTAARPVR